MRDELNTQQKETLVDARVVALTQQLSWFQREALLQQEDKKKLIERCKNLELKCEMLREDVRFFQRNTVESKQQELVARRAIGVVVAEGNENKNDAANSVKEVIKNPRNGIDGCRVEPKNQNEEIIMSLFQKHNVDLN